MITCPKCKYQRQPQDNVPDWQCPSCGVAYNKVKPPEPATQVTAPEGADYPEPQPAVPSYGPRLALGIVVILILAFFVHKLRQDPYGTKLPDSYAGVASVQSRLDKLPAADQQLVVEYLQRRDGAKAEFEKNASGVEIVHSPSEFTAHTFAEAIAFEKQDRAGLASSQKQIDNNVAAYRSLEDKAYEPLRSEIQFTLVSREMQDIPMFRQTGITIVRNGIEYDTRGAKLPLPTMRKALVLNFRAFSRTDKFISGFDGYMDLYQGKRQAMSFTTAQCELSRRNIDLRAGETISVACFASGESQKAMDTPLDGFDINWQPKTIYYADGSTLQYHEPTFPRRTAPQNP